MIATPTNDATSSSAASIASSSSVASPRVTRKTPELSSPRAHESVRGGACGYAGSRPASAIVRGGISTRSGDSVLSSLGVLSAPISHPRLVHVTENRRPEARNLPSAMWWRACSTLCASTTLPALGVFRFEVCPERLDRDLTQKIANTEGHLQYSSISATVFELRVLGGWPRHLARAIVAWVNVLAQMRHTPPVASRVERNLAARPDSSKEPRIGQCLSLNLCFRPFAEVRSTAAMRHKQTFLGWLASSPGTIMPKP
jgi:hypothetical protein